MTTLYQKAHSFEAGAVGALQYLDVAVVVIGVVVAAALGAPSLGVIVGGAGWLLQRAVQRLDTRLTARLRDSYKRAAIRVFEAFGRIWLLAGAIVVAGVAGGRRDGLAAAIVIFVAYSIAFAIRIVNGAPPILDGPSPIVNASPPARKTH